MYTVHCIGLIYFHVCDERDRVAWMPNGTDAGADIDVHRGSLFVHPEDVQSGDWWSGWKYEHEVTIVDDDGNEKPVPVVEFRLPAPATIMFEGSGRSLDLGNLEAGLPKMKDSDPAFEVDPSDASAIGRVPVTQGQLAVYKLGSTAAVQWRIESSGSISVAIEVGRDTKVLTLKERGADLGTEIVLANTSDLINPPDDQKAGDHFQLYRKLKRESNTGELKPPELPKGLDPLPYDHRYLKFLASHDEIPGTSCTPTCC